MTTVFKLLALAAFSFQLAFPAATLFVCRMTGETHVKRCCPGKKETAPGSDALKRAGCCFVQHVEALPVGRAVSSDVTTAALLAAAPLPTIALPLLAEVDDGPAQVADKPPPRGSPLYLSVKHLLI